MLNGQPVPANVPIMKPGAGSRVCADSVVNDPFGKTLATTGTKPTIGFQGDWTDPANGLVWMAARWYDTQTGTFTSRDSYPGEIGPSVTPNRYTYGRNNPLQFTDFGYRSEVLVDVAVGPVTDRLVVLTGPRRVGKSVVLLDAAAALCRRPDIDPRQIIHVPCDGPQDLRRALMLARELTKVIDRSEPKRPVWLLDEVTSIGVDRHTQIRA